jgi:pyruvate kinase
MVDSNQKPAPIDKYKRTKMIITLGPSIETYEEILAIIQAGANGIRLNCSHGSPEERRERINFIRKASKASNKPVAVILDLQGPKLRLGNFEGVITIKAGQQVSFAVDANFEKEQIVPLQYDLSQKVQRGDSLSLHDGMVKFEVNSVKDGIVYAKALNGGTIVKNQGVNAPDTNFGGDVITTKDKQDIAFGADQGVEYIALSYVQSAEDIRNLRRILKNLGSMAKIIAKIETKSATNNLEEIIIEADAVMVARGDLAVETLPESVPLTQRKIIHLGRIHAKPTIVATQLLASMTSSNEPTRAEVSDVATAVLLGADCLMLSDETAVGINPRSATSILKRVIVHTEQNSMDYTYQTQRLPGRQSAISSAIISLAEDVRAAAIVAETKSGATALNISALRPRLTIIAVTSLQMTANQLAIVYGIKSYLRPDDAQAAYKLTNWLYRNKILAQGDVVVTCSGQYPGVVGTTDTIKVRIIE